MKLGSLFFLIYEAFRNIKRNGLMSLAALGTVAIAVAILGATLWSALRIHEVASTQPQKLNEIVAFLKVGATRAEATRIQGKVSHLPFVRSVNLLPREKAWEEMQSGLSDIEEAELENPLPDALKIVCDDVRKMDSIAKKLSDKSQFPEIAHVASSNQEVQTLLAFSYAVQVIGGATAIALFIATLVIIHNTIRLTVFARRREIRIMQMVGATPGFIRFPLLVEGFCYGIVGALLASLLLLLAERQTANVIGMIRSPILSDAPSAFQTWQVVLLLILIGSVLGLIGSFLAIRRFLKQI